MTKFKSQEFVPQARGRVYCLYHYDNNGAWPAIACSIVHIEQKARIRQGSAWSSSLAPELLVKNKKYIFGVLKKLMEKSPFAPTLLTFAHPPQHQPALADFLLSDLPFDDFSGRSQKMQEKAIQKRCENETKRSENNRKPS